MIKQSDIKTGIAYLSGPIGNGHTQTIEKMLSNVVQSYPIHKELMLRGWAVINPMLTFYPWKHWQDKENFDMPWEKWLEADKKFVHIVDALFYLVPEIYGPSKGAALEVEWANKIGKPVFTDINQVPFIDENLVIRRG